MRALLLLLGFGLIAGGLRAQSAAWQPPPGHTQVPIWPGSPPDARPATAPETVAIGGNPVAGRPWHGVRDVSRPTMTVFPPTGGNSGVAVVVFPGGGYEILAIDLEGTEVCEWLASHGITGVRLKYRVPAPRSSPNWGAYFTTRSSGA